MSRALSYSAYKNYKECPLRYLKQNVEREKPKVPKDEYNVVYGSVVQKVFENFYNDQIWRKGKMARDVLVDSVPSIFQNLISKRNIFWDKHGDEEGKQELLHDCVESVRVNVDVIKEHKLIGPFAKSEVNTYCYLNSQDQIGGRIDFVIKKENQVLLLDGKGSKYRDRYLDKTQLHWYALSYYILHRRMPDSLWFWLYRFPEDPLIEIEFDTALLKNLKNEILETILNIKKRQFKPTPSSKSCKFCPYSGECKFESDHKNKGKLLVPQGSGFEMVGLDDD